MKTLPARLTRLAALAVLTACLGCAAAAQVIANFGPAACGVLVAVLGPRGQYWGTACKGLVQGIADEIAADTTPAARLAAASECPVLVPVPGFEGSAMVCKGLETAAARGAQKALAAAGGSLPGAADAGVLPSKGAAK